MFSLPSLSYDYAALEPHFDEQTMRIHHTKHHQTYIDKLNAALEPHSDLLSQPIDSLLRTIEQLPQEVQLAVRNHGGGHANHTLFWTQFSPQPRPLADSELRQAIEVLAGDETRFKDQFTQAAAGLFGSGWAWLVFDIASQQLALVTYPNQDSPLMHNQVPLLGLDVWEHAYYLKYQNRRPEYIQAFWNVIDWTEINRRYQQAQVGDGVRSE